MRRFHAIVLSFCGTALSCGASDPVIDARTGAPDSGASHVDAFSTPEPDAAAESAMGDETAPVADASTSDVLDVANDPTTSLDLGIIEAAADGDSAGPVRHRFLTGVSHQGPIAIVGTDGALEWS